MLLSQVLLHVCILIMGGAMFKKASTFFKGLAVMALVSFVATVLMADMFRVKTSQAAMLGLPEPSQILKMSGSLSLPVLQGLKIDPSNPMEIDFIVDRAGQDNLSEEISSQLVRYFLSALAVPNESLWVNLSPYESERVIDDTLGITELGRDFLGQDYILKQLSSSMTHPDTELGKDYWKSVGLNSQSFNKLWIVPNESEVHEENNMVMISKSSLKAMMEEDYMAMAQNNLEADSDSEVKTQSTRDLILPKINKEINEGKNFAVLRQMYNSIILAKWFKLKFKESFYNHYMDQNKINGVDLEDKETKDKVFNLYKEAFEKGVYDLIKKEYNPEKAARVKRHYFSGGLEMSSSVTVVDGLKNFIAQTKDKIPGYSNLKINLKPNLEAVANAAEGFSKTLMMGVAGVALLAMSTFAGMRTVTVDNEPATKAFAVSQGTYLEDGQSIQVYAGFDQNFNLQGDMIAARDSLRELAERLSSSYYQELKGIDINQITDSIETLEYSLEQAVDSVSDFMNARLEYEKDSIQRDYSDTIATDMANIEDSLTALRYSLAEISNNYDSEMFDLISGVNVDGIADSIVEHKNRFNDITDSIVAAMDEKHSQQREEFLRGNGAKVISAVSELKAEMRDSLYALENTYSYFTSAEFQSLLSLDANAVQQEIISLHDSLSALGNKMIDLTLQRRSNRDKQEVKDSLAQALDTLNTKRVELLDELDSLERNMGTINTEEFQSVRNTNLDSLRQSINEYEQKMSAKLDSLSNALNEQVSAEFLRQSADNVNEVSDSVNSATEEVVRALDSLNAIKRFIESDDYKKFKDVNIKEVVTKLDSFESDRKRTLDLAQQESEERLDDKIVEMYNQNRIDLVTAIGKVNGEMIPAIERLRGLRRSINSDEFQELQRHNVEDVISELNHLENKIKEAEDSLKNKQEENINSVDSSDSEASSTDSLTDISDELTAAVDSMQEASKQLRIRLANDTYKNGIVMGQDAIELHREMSNIVDSMVNTARVVKDSIDNSGRPDRFLRLDEKTYRELNEKFGGFERMAKGYKDTLMERAYEEGVTVVEGLSNEAAMEQQKMTEIIDSLIGAAEELRGTMPDGIEKDVAFVRLDGNVYSELNKKFNNFETIAQTFKGNLIARASEEGLLVVEGFSAEAANEFIVKQQTMDEMIDSILETRSFLDNLEYVKLTETFGLDIDSQLKDLEISAEEFKTNLYQSAYKNGIMVIEEIKESSKDLLFHVDSVQGFSTRMYEGFDRSFHLTNEMSAAQVLVTLNNEMTYSVDSLAALEQQLKANPGQDTVYVRTAELMNDVTALLMETLGTALKSLSNAQADDSKAGLDNYKAEVALYNQQLEIVAYNTQLDMVIDSLKDTMDNDQSDSKAKENALIILSNLKNMLNDSRKNIDEINAAINSLNDAQGAEDKKKLVNEIHAGVARFRTEMGAASEGLKGGIDMAGIDIKTDASSSIMQFAPFDIAKFTGFTFVINSISNLTAKKLLAMAG